MKSSLPPSPQEKRPANGGAYRIILVDDDALFRHNLKKILLDGSGLEVTGEAGDGIEFLERLNSAGPSADLAILDISMPRLGGIEATAKAKHLHPGMKVLILSMHREREYIQAATAAGADGYVLKEDVDLELFAAIEKIRRGGTYISPLLTGKDNGTT